MERPTWHYSVANIFLILFFIIIALSSFGIWTAPVFVTGIVATVIVIALLAHL
jgi:hypothetical protein